jgi:hypothetical protein
MRRVLAAGHLTARLVCEFGITVSNETRPTMSRRDRKRVHPRVSDELQTRWLLTAPQIPGNVGQVVFSQFQPFGFKTTVGTQLRDVKLRGPFKIDVVNPFPSADPSQTPPAPPINSGLIGHSQFNGGGFRTVGLQFDRVKLGGGLTVSGFDNENPGASATAETLSSVSGVAPTSSTLPAFMGRFSGPSQPSLETHADRSEHGRFGTAKVPACSMIL